MKAKLFVPIFLIILAAMAWGIWFGFGKYGGSVTKVGGEMSSVVKEQTNTQDNSKPSSRPTVEGSRANQDNLEDIDWEELMDTSTWKVYENTNIGLRFLYPKTWKVSVDTADDRVGFGYKVVVTGINPDNRKDPFGNINQDAIFINLSSQDYYNGGSEEHNHFSNERIDLKSDSAVTKLIANTKGSEKAYMYRPAISDNDFAILYSYTEWQGFIANVYALNQNTNHKLANISINYPIGYEIEDIKSVENVFKSYPKTKSFVLFNTLLSTFEFDSQPAP